MFRNANCEVTCFTISGRESRAKRAGCSGIEGYFVEEPMDNPNLCCDSGAQGPLSGFCLLGKRIKGKAQKETQGQFTGIKKKKTARLTSW